MTAGPDFILDPSDVPDGHISTTAMYDVLNCAGLASLAAYGGKQAEVWELPMEAGIAATAFDPDRKSVV